MSLTVEQQLLRHNIEVADGEITASAADLRVLIFSKEDELNEARNEGYEEGMENGHLRGVIETREALKEFAEEL